MITRSPVRGRREVEAEKERLQEVSTSWPVEMINDLVREYRLNPEGSVEELRDRIIRYDLRRVFRAEAAYVYPLRPQDMANPGLFASLPEGLDDSVESSSEETVGDVPATRCSGAGTSTTVTITTTSTTLTLGATSSTTRPISSVSEQPPNNHQLFPHLYTPIRPVAPHRNYALHSTAWAPSTLAAPEGQIYPGLDPSSPPFNPVPHHTAPQPTAPSQFRSPLSQQNIFPQHISQPQFRNAMPQGVTHPAQEDASRTNASYGYPSSYSLDSTLQRENGTCNLLSRYDVLFSGQPKEDVEEFLEKLQDFQDSQGITDNEILRFVPVILTGSARYWARPLFRSWSSVNDMAAALRLQYGIPDFQNRLKDEIHARTQGPEEPIASYLSSMRHLMDKCLPRWSLQTQLDKIYRNLHPDFSDVVSRGQFRSFEELQSLCYAEEIKRERRRAYRPPPPSERTLFPELAYKPVRRSRVAAINRTETVNDFSCALNPDQEPIAAIQQSPASNKPKLPDNRKIQPRLVTQNPAPKPSLARKSTNTQTTRVYDSLASPQRVAPIKRSIAIQTSSAQSSQVEPRASNSRPPSPTNSPCWVCKREGHWAKECPSKNGIVCYRCNYPGVTTPRCPNCNPQTQRGNDRRGN